MVPSKLALAIWVPSGFQTTAPPICMPLKVCEQLSGGNPRLERFHLGWRWRFSFHRDPGRPIKLVAIRKRQDWLRLRHRDEYRAVYGTSGYAISIRTPGDGGGKICVLPNLEKDLTRRCVPDNSIFSAAEGARDAGTVRTPDHFNPHLRVDTRGC